MVAQLLCRDRFCCSGELLQQRTWAHVPSMVWRMRFAFPLPGGMQDLAKRCRRSPILWGTVLDSMATGHKDVVQGLLLSPCLFQLIRISPISLHADQGLVVAMGSLVYLHLLVALLFQRLQS